MPKKRDEQGSDPETEGVQLPEEVLAVNETLVEAAKVKEQQAKEAPSVRMADKASYTVRVKFLEAHQMTVGQETFVQKVGDIIQVEPHIANRLVARKIAYII